MPFAEFASTFGDVAGIMRNDPRPQRELAMAVLEKMQIPKEKYKVGRERLFLALGILDRLKTLRTEAMIERAVEKVKKSLRTATIDDVGDWLHALGLGHHATTFADHAVDGQLLAELSEEELRDDLGVHKIGDRAKIRRARDRVAAFQAR